MAYFPTIGLEIHAELKTKTKMFCNSKNDPFAAAPNVNICSVCLAHPGTLPVINREAVRHVLRVGVAIGGQLADYTEFDRKNYFYPDLPKGYQISQYEFPLVSGGKLAGIDITRIHLEEDTASSSHDETGETHIDYNRGGVPLMELVTEPVIHSAEEAGNFAREWQLLLRYLDASDADMEKGHMRLEANISVAKVTENNQDARNNIQRGDTLRDPKVSPQQTLGTKVEVKNINSFRAMEKAIEYEIKRQTALLESGGIVVQETRGWDDAKQATFSQRIKEGSADYRYFPDPDLPSLRISEIEDFQKEKLQNSLPELPEARRTRYISLGIKKADADQFVSYPHLGAFLDEIAASHGNDKEFIQKTANYIANDLASIIAARNVPTSTVARDTNERDTILRAEIPISAEHFGKIISLISEGKISSRVAKDLLLHVIEEGRDPEEIAVERKLLITTSAADIGGVVDRVLGEHASVVEDYKKGKEAALQFLIGQCMRELKGAADPAALRKRILEKITK